MDLLNTNQTNNDNIKVIEDTVNDTCFNSIEFDEGIGNNKKAPINGNNKI